MDEYRFNSETEPAEEYLHTIMKEAAQDARERYQNAHDAYFAQISEQIRAL